MKYPGLIEFGSKNAVAVKEIKNRLNVLLGTSLDTNNGNFGESTKKLVMEFQRKNSLLPDGRVGDLTWSRLQEARSTQADSSSIMSSILTLFRKQLRVRELTGHNDGKEVEEYLESVGLGRGYSWCMAFMYWGFDTVCEMTRKKNPLIKTGGVLAQWNKQDSKFKVFKNPQPGDIFIMDFGKGAGHTGIVTELVGNDRFHSIEGNTSADPKIPTEDREGNGVFERSRKISSVKGFLRFTEKDFQDA